MHRITTLVAGLVLAVAVSAMGATIHVPADQPTIQKMNKTPLAFTKNMGQWDERVLFRTTAGGATMWFTKEGVTYQFTRDIGRGTRRVPDSSWAHAMRPYDPGDRDSIEQLVLTAKFVGANPSPEVVAEGQMEYKCNYFIGNEPSEWHIDVPNYEAITLKDIYPGIDLNFSGDDGQASYEFVAALGADIAQIKVEYEGAEETSLDADGRLILKTKWGDMIATIKTPTNGELAGGAGFSQQSERTIGIEAAGANRHTLDTQVVWLVYSTYLGGEHHDYGNSIAVDDDGSAYVTGYTSSSDFPTQDPYQTDQGNEDVFVTKLSSSGNNLIYSTYIGGTSYDEGACIAVDDGGSAYVTGLTFSSNFPTMSPFQTYQGGWDAFVIKLSSSGNDLIYCTYLGGGGDDGGSGIAVDGSGNAYATGETSSANFPILNSYQTYQGGSDAFVTKLSSAGSDLTYSTFLGGGGGDAGLGIAVDGSGNAYVAGTAGSNFPTLNSYQTYHGSGDAFVAKLTASGDGLTYGTYLGGGGNDICRGIAIDGSGSAYVTGTTNSADFPVQNPLQLELAGGSDVFVTRLSSSGNSLIYSTYLGGVSGDNGYAIAVEESGNAFVTGLTDSPDFPIVNPFQTHQGGYDAFVTELSSSGAGLIYCTYLGGGGDDGGRGIAVNGRSNAYVTGVTQSSDFPIQNPYQTDQGINDVFVARIVPFYCAPTAAVLIAPESTLTLPVLSLRPAFSWTASTDSDPFDIVTYSLFVAMDSNFAFVEQIPTLIDTSYTLSADLQWDERYWWKVRASDKYGGSTWSSQVFTFRTVTLGDASNDGAVDISDAVYLINYIFGGGPEPTPMFAGDANCDTAVDISDAVYLVAFIFSGGPAPCGEF
jgi:hypothetical protein